MQLSTPSLDPYMQPDDPKQNNLWEVQEESQIIDTIHGENCWSFAMFFLCIILKEYIKALFSLEITSMTW